MAKKAFDLKEEQIQWVNDVLAGHKHELNQSQILIEALSDWALKKEAGGAIANAPEGYKNMFSGDKDKLLSALDMIRSTYINLMVVTSEKLDEQEREMRELFGARLRELNAEKDKLQEQLDGYVSTVEKAQSDVNAANQAKQEAIDKLQSALDTNTSLVSDKEELEKDKKNLEADKTALTNDKNSLNQTIVEKDAEITKLKALETTNITLKEDLEKEKVNVQLKDQEINGYKTTITRLEAVEEKYESLRDEYSVVNAQKAAAEALAEDRKAEIETLKGDLVAERQKTEKSQNELAVERKKVEDLQKQLDELLKKKK